jgi:hypothetical protein
MTFDELLSVALSKEGAAHVADLSRAIGMQESRGRLNDANDACYL